MCWHVDVVRDVTSLVSFARGIDYRSPRGINLVICLPVSYYLVQYILDVCYLNLAYPIFI
jgi:hypothetical protein